MERKKNIDILKVIGLLCIILAHVVPNNGIIFQIRNFDVILMIMISVYLFFNIYIEKDKITFKYLIKRINRLLIPTYIFLFIYFLVFTKYMGYNLKTIISTFILHSGIGYVWIIRIYLIVAIILPLIVSKLRKNYKITSILIIIVYCIYELTVKSLMNIDNLVLEDVILYIPSILFIILVTYKIMNSNNKKVIIFSIINFLIFIFCAFLIYQSTGQIKNTNYMKYPFRIYYLSYAFTVSSILIVIFRNKNITDFFYNKFFEFISKSSLWIYLWHIFFLTLVKFLKVNWIIKYIIIVSFSIIITYIQNQLIDILEKHNINNKFFKFFRG